MELKEIFGFVIPIVGVVVWFIRLEGRVNVTEALQKEMKEDVAYIRERIDNALNGRHR